MLRGVTSIETSTASTTTSSRSQDKDNTETVIPVEISSERESQVPSNEEPPVTKICSQPPLFIPEPRSNSSENSPYDSIVFEELFHVSTGQSSFRESCPMLAAHCSWLWIILNSPYSIPFWLLLMAAPVSASVLGSLHMHSCPGAANLTILIFSMGVSYSAACIIKIGFILLKLLDAEEIWKPLLKNIFGITAVITIGLCVTESAYFWQMEPSQEPGTLKYCDPEFMTYAFWWNCFMWFGVIILFFCQG